MMTYPILSQPTPAQISTCATCPKFHDYEDRGRGLCLVFDRVVRKRHTLTSDCVQQMKTNTKKGEYTSGIG